MGMDRWGDITLINPGGAYSQVVDRIIHGITRHLPAWNVWPFPCKGTFNIHFFREWVAHPSDANKMLCDMFIAHGWNQKLFGVFKANMEHFRYSGVPGPMTQDFLVSKGMERERLPIVGHPGMDTIINGNVPIVPEDDDRQRVVMATTHSSFYGFWKELPVKFSDAFLEEFNVVTVKHPARGWRLSRDYMRGAAAVISDVSGTIFEAWTFGVPVIFPHWLVAESVINNTPGAPLSRIYAEEVGFHVKQQDDFEKIVRYAVAHGITQEEVAFIDDYFPPELRGHSGEVAAKEILRLAEAS